MRRGGIMNNSTSTSRRVVILRQTTPLFLSILFLLLQIQTCISLSDDTTNKNDDDIRRMARLKERLYDAKMELWSRGEYDMMDGSRLSDDKEEQLASHYSNNMNANLNSVGSLTRLVERMEDAVSWSPIRLGPVSKVRREYKGGGGCIEIDCPGSSNSLLDRLGLKMRGGGVASTTTTSTNTQKKMDVKQYNLRLKSKINELSMKHGPEFITAIQRNEKEHAEDCETSCHSFYCKSSSDTTTTTTTTDAPYPLHQNTTIKSYSFGPTPPEDFAETFGFPLDLIKVTTGTPLLTPDEASDVLLLAQSEGIEHNEYQSGKYKLGGDWLTNLPKTRAWFNQRLETTLFPLVAGLFPEILSGPEVLRAHSVSLLKYNSSHPRTDVHVDNGILAMTLAMTPSAEYHGGGTFFEHMGVDHVLPMDVGHGTFRPGSVRHGGHKVTKGTRYILGAFLLITDRVEHVRRLKNRGSERRRQGDLEGATKLFEWALDLNPVCVTCLKDWAEILVTQKNYPAAESKVRRALELLEERDSDGLFSLGVILSEQGKDNESIAAYQKSLALNAGDDAQLCYNLGIKLGVRGDTVGEMKMYARATSIDPGFGGAWLNWGTSLAESGDIDNAEVMFLKGLSCSEVAPKAMMNLALVYQKKANALAATGDLNGAKSAVENAVRNLERAKPLLDDAILATTGSSGADEERRYMAQFRPIRLACYRMMGSIFAGMKDLEGSEREFRNAVQNFPDAPAAWQMLVRVLQMQGKVEEASQAMEELKLLPRG